MALFFFAVLKMRIQKLSRRLQGFVGTFLPKKKGQSYFS
jgi:hypothetical protein